VHGPRSLRIPPLISVFLHAPGVGPDLGTVTSRAVTASLFCISNFQTRRRAGGGRNARFYFLKRAIQDWTFDHFVGDRSAIVDIKAQGDRNRRWVFRHDLFPGRPTFRPSVFPFLPSFLLQISRRGVRGPVVRVSGRGRGRASAASRRSGTGEMPPEFLPRVEPAPKIL